jgi:hypothetical protein
MGRRIKGEYSGVWRVTYRDRETDEKKLKGNLGVASIVLMVVATAAPLTVMVASSPLIIGMGNGAAAPVDAGIATLIMLVFTVGFVAMSPYITNAGAFYAYIQKGMGRCMGLGSATLALMSYSCILIGLEAYLGAALASFLAEHTGISINWMVLSAAVVGLVAFFGYRDLELSSKFLGVALIMEIAIVLVLNGAIFITNPAGMITSVPVRLETILSGSPGLGILFAVYSFVGFESTVVYREEAVDPDRTIPRATFLSVIIVGKFYMVSMWCEVVGIGFDDIRTTATNGGEALYIDLSRAFLGHVATNLMEVLVVTSLFACILSLHNIIVRYQHVLSRNGILHPAISAVHRGHGTPHISSMAQSITSFAALFGLGALGLSPTMQIYAWGATAGTLGYMCIVALTSLAVILFFRREGGNAGLWRTLVAPGLGFIGLMFCVYIAVDNLPDLIGGTNAQLAALGIVAFIISAFMLGCIIALAMRTRQPERYALLAEPG